MVKERRALGRGLSELFGEDLKVENIISVPPSSIVPNPRQPRVDFEEQPIAELAESIRTHGILQPLLVRPKGELYELIAGERRLRAAKLAQQDTIPCRVLMVDERGSFEVALLENIHRENLGALEEAQGYQHLMSDFGYTQEQLSKIIGKSRSHISNLMRVLTLPDDIQTLVRDGKISVGHAKVIASSGNPRELASAILENGLTVRQTESRSWKKRQEKEPETNCEVTMIASQFSAWAGIPVTIRLSKGEVVFHIKDAADLEDLLEKVSPPRLASAG